MNRVLYKTVMVASLLLTMGRPAHGRPPNNDVSDESGNTAGGTNALLNNIGGYNNTAFGDGALWLGNNGSHNIAVDYTAGTNLTSGNNNIYVGSKGVSSESNILRLGTAQTHAFIAGLTGTSIMGNTVMIDSKGQLGTLVSSERYKQDIQPLTDQHQKLQQLRPVTFHYKQEPKGSLQYGLIAEEVAQIYLELVTRDGTGKVVVEAR